MSRLGRNKFIVFFLILALCFYNVCDVKAAKRRKEIKHTFRMMEIADGGAQLYTILDVFSVGTEEFSFNSKYVTYKKRDVYAYFKEITALTYYECGVSPIRHVNSSGGNIKTFSWKKQSGLYPGDVCYTFSKYNDTPVTYSRTNTNKAQWSVGVSAPDAFIPYEAKTGTINLYIGIK